MSLLNLVLDLEHEGTLSIHTGSKRFYGEGKDFDIAVCYETLSDEDQETVNQISSDRAGEDNLDYEGKFISIRDGDYNFIVVMDREDYLAWVHATNMFIEMTSGRSGRLHLRRLTQSDKKLRVDMFEALWGHYRRMAEEDPRP